MTNDLARHRADAVSGDVSGAARRQPGRQGAGVRACGRWRRATSATPPPTGTAASTTPRPAAAPAWCCAPTCWRRRSMPPDIAPDRPRLLMSPRGRPLTQSRVAELAAGPGPADRLRPVRGHRPAGHRGPRARGGLDRRLRAVRRRNRRHGADRRLRPAVAGGDGQTGLRRRTRAFPTDYWNTRNIPARRSSRAGRSRKS